MAITLVYGATTINLSDDFIWPDEYAWRAVEAKKTYSITGSLLVESALKLAGRPITLAPDTSGPWVARSVLDALLVASYLPAQQFTLTLRGVAYTVRFDHEAGPVDARAVVDYSDVLAADFYIVTLKFIVVT